jgi:uncharacterized membrane protein YgcG
LSRTRIIALFAALFALATGIAACGGGGGSGSEADVEEVFANATLQGVESGKVDMVVDVSSKGESAGDVSVTLAGAFQKQAGEELPQLDMDLAAKGNADGEAVNFKGGLTLLSDRAFVDLEGTEYEVDPTTFGFVKSNFEQEQQAAPEEAEGDEGSEACREAVEGLKLSSFVDDAKNEGSAEVDGQETTKISGDLDVAAAADAMIGLTEGSACESQLQGAGPLPLDELEAAKDEVAAAVKKAHADVYVGEDGIIRRIAAQLVVEPEGQGRVDVDIDFTLSEVNEDQEIAAPAKAEPLEGLFQNLGINPLELLEGGGSEGIVGLLEGLLDEQGLGGGSGGSGDDSGGSGGGDSGGGSGSSGGDDLDQQQAYFECLQEVETAKDLQQCASLAP